MEEVKKNLIPLTKLPMGEYGKVVSIDVEGLMRRRLLDLGFVPNSIIKMVRKSPMGDPIAYEVKGTVIGLRSEESNKIFIERM